MQISPQALAWKKVTCRETRMCRESSNLQPVTALQPKLPITAAVCVKQAATHRVLDCEQTYFEEAEGHTNHSLDQTKSLVGEKA